MGDITYLKGDALAPAETGQKLVLHICNDLGYWGAGFVMAISNKWSSPEKQYKAWQKNGFSDFGLGMIQAVDVEKDITIINMVAQHGVFRTSARPNVRYIDLEMCLDKVAAKYKPNNVTIHMPRIGCGLGGGKWDKVEPLIESCLTAKNYKVFVYDFV